MIDILGKNLFDCWQESYVKKKKKKGEIKIKEGERRDTFVKFGNLIKSDVFLR